MHPAGGDRLSHLISGTGVGWPGSFIVGVGNRLFGDGGNDGLEHGGDASLTVGVRSKPFREGRSAPVASLGYGSGSCFGVW